MPYPHAKRVTIPELGPDAWIEMENPLMLPREQPFPRELRGDDADPAAVEEEIERRARLRYKRLIRDWQGIYDVDTGEALPLPRDDESVYDKIPLAVFAKIRQAQEAITADEEWDPTKRPERAPVTEGEGTTTGEASATPSEKTSPSPSSPATSEDVPTAS